MDKELTLYDICADNHYVFGRLENDGDITTEVHDEQGNVVYKEKSHPAAWDALAAFAGMILIQNEMLKKSRETF